MQSNFASRVIGHLQYMYIFDVDRTASALARCSQCLSFKMDLINCTICKDNHHCFNVVNRRTDESPVQNTSTAMDTYFQT